MPSFLDASAEIHVFVIVEELLIESSEVSQQICANQNETP